MDSSPLLPDRSRGLLYLEAGSRNVASKLRLVELSSREIASGLRNEYSNLRLHPSQSRSVSPLRPQNYSKARLNPVGKPRENPYREAERWLEQALPGDVRDVYDEGSAVRRKMSDQIDLLKDCKPALDCNLELINDSSDGGSSPLVQFFRSNVVRDYKVKVGKEDKVHCETLTVDARRLPYHCQCIRCGILVLTDDRDPGFECMYCRLGKPATRSETCGAVCVEAVVESHRSSTPGRVRSRKDGDPPEDDSRPYKSVFRILLSESLLTRSSVPSERSSWQSFPPKSDSPTIPATPTFSLPAHPLERLLKDAVSTLRKTAKTINIELGSRMEEQSTVLLHPKFPQCLTQRASELLSEYSRCLRTVLRGVLQVLPEHAIAVERLFFMLTHLCEVCYQGSRKEVDVFREEMGRMKEKSEDAVALKVRIRSLEREIVLQEVKMKAKIDSLTRMNRKYEEMMRLCPSD